MRGALAALVTSAVLSRTGSRPSGPGMTRTNHAERPVSLWEGPAVVLGLLAGATSAQLFAAVSGAALAGALDDHGRPSSAKGLTGHLRELRHGRVTTGTGKLLLLTATGVSASLLGEPERTRRGSAVPHWPRRSWLDRLSYAALVAGCANLTNLLDLRPGRALKTVLLTALPLLGTSRTASNRPGPHGRGTGQGPRRRPAADTTGSAGVVLGAAAAALADDLTARTMLGDTGANALGAATGVALSEGCGRRGRLVALAVVTALTLASERVSFTAVIGRTPVLRELDAWGRTVA